MICTFSPCTIAAPRKTSRRPESCIRIRAGSGKSQRCRRRLPVHSASGSAVKVAAGSFLRTHATRHPQIATTTDPSRRLTPYHRRSRAPSYHFSLDGHVTTQDTNATSYFDSLASVSLIAKANQEHHDSSLSKAHTVDHSDEYFGTKVADPYAGSKIVIRPKPRLRSRREQVTASVSRSHDPPIHPAPSGRSS